MSFMVAISYGKGVVLCEQWGRPITGDKFAAIVRCCFKKAFRNSANPKAKHFLMDGCPRQNSKTAMHAIDRVDGKVFRIPAQSLDLSLIEKVFNSVTIKSNNDAIDKKITRESFEEFSKCVKETMLSFSSKEVDKIIDSVDKRITAVMKGKSKRTKY